MIGHYFRALSYGYHAPLNSQMAAGAVLWFKVRDTPHVRIVGELGMQQASEPELADQIRATERQLGIAKIRYTVATPAIFPRKETSYRGVIGQYVAQRLAQCGIHTIMADEDSLNGWARVQAYLRQSADQRPWLSIDPGCEELIKSMASALSDADHPEELQITSPFLVALRYGLMSRPAPSLNVTSQKIPSDCPLAIMRKLRQQGRRFGGVRTYA